MESDKNPEKSTAGIEITHPFTLYYGNRVVTVHSASPIGPILRLCSNDDVLFVLNKSHNLYTGSYDGFNDCITLELLETCVIDIDLFNEILYIVKENGSVYKTEITSISADNWDEIEFTKTADNERLQICRVKSNSIGTIYISSDLEAYGCGTYSEILNSERPVQLECLRKKRICDINAGIDFFIFLIYGEMDEDEEEESASDLLGLNKLPTQNKSNNFVAISHTSANTFEVEVSLSDEEESLHSDISKTTQCSDDVRRSTKALLRKGYCILNTSVHSLGSRNGGILGTGDHIKRTGLNSVLSLRGIGVCSVSCGREHSIARTIDGRLFQWGMNHNQQIQPNGKIVDISAPKELKHDINTKSTECSILDACCGDLSTLLLNSELSLIENGRSPIKRDFVLKNVHGIFPFILSSNNFVLQNHKTVAKEYEIFLMSMQMTVKNLIQNKCQLQFLKYIPNTNHNSHELLNEAFELYQRYLKLTYLLVLCLQSVDCFYRNEQSGYHQLVFVECSKELIQAFSEYSELYCDIKSINGFQEIKKTINCVDIGLYPECEDAFYQPFVQISNILKFFENLVKNNDADKVLIEKLQEWRAFFNRNQIEIELAENSNEFWQKAKNSQLIQFKKSHRRIILDSNRVPLRLLNGGKFSNNSFILFSDFFCQYGSALNIYPLSTVWTQIENETSIKLVTPEKRFTLITRSHEDKMLWYDQFEKSINAILEKPVSDKMPKLRCAGYKYSEKHGKFADVWCYGRWKLGEMHGVCHLEYPDGKVYFGEMRHDDIEGFGKMLLPSVGMYEGSFRGSKFHGFGIYEMRDNEIYEGNFRDGLFDGHGTLRGKAYTYVGQFVKNVKHGYGILDDAFSGDKYMGMFFENKRSGPGICITMNGDYFEGFYKNDTLTGEGLAIFENGCYYQGELNMTGPSGQGKYFIPQTEVKNGSDYNENSVHMKGSIISGNLGGSWDDVKVINGAVLLNQAFLKYPSAIGDRIISNNRKWSTLLENWEEEVLGGLHMVDTNLIWSKIAIYMKNLEEKEKIRDHDSTKAGNYFAKNITMQMANSALMVKNSSSLDMISLRSTNSLNMMQRGSTLKLNNRRKSYSNEILFDRARTGSRRYRNSPKNTTTTTANYSAAAMNWKILYDTSFAAEHNVIGEMRNGSGSMVESSLPQLEYIPNFGIKTLSDEDVDSIRDYLAQAFKDHRHPLYVLNQKISNCFYLSYGCWKVKPTPVLSSQAMCEWESISLRLFHIIQKMFPALTQVQTDRDSALISHISLLYPIVLSEGIYSTLFVLYANKYSHRDELYRQRLVSCEKKTNGDLLRFLSFENSLETTVNNTSFDDAIATLKQVKEKYCPHGMLDMIKKSIQLIEQAYQNSTEKAVALAADNIMPLSIILVIRADVPHLGAELALLEDLLGKDFETVMLGFAGYCYTTIKATYEHIISEKFYLK